MDTVMESELMKKARHKIDYRVEVHSRNDRTRTAEIRSGWSLIDYLGMKWMLIRNNTFIVKYPIRMLLKAKEYTDWISETIKEDEMRENERRVGLLKTPRKYDPSKRMTLDNCPEHLRKAIYS